MPDAGSKTPLKCPIARKITTADDDMVPQPNSGASRSSALVAARTWRHLGDGNLSKPRNSQQAPVIRETGRGNCLFRHAHHKSLIQLDLLGRVVKAAGVEPVQAEFLNS